MSTPYEQFGGEQFFTDLVADFYRGGPGSRIAPMYPEQDLGPAERRLRMFLEQYWEGRNLLGRTWAPQTARHARSKSPTTTVTSGSKHMRDALWTTAAPAEQDRVMWDYLVMAAQSMVNQPTTRSGNAARSSWLTQPRPPVPERMRRRPTWEQH